MAVAVAVAVAVAEAATVLVALLVAVAGVVAVEDAVAVGCVVAVGDDVAVGCTPVGVASWPVSGILPRPCAFSDEITAPARPSLAAIDASMWLPLRARIWSKIRRPLIGSQSVHWSPAVAFLKVPFLYSGLRIES